MKKMLMLTSVASMVDQFFIPHIELLIKMGYKVDMACNYEIGSTCTDAVIGKLKKKLESMGVNYCQIDFMRSVFDFKGNVKAYNQVKKLISENKYDFIHCHSPIGGVVGRLVGLTTKTKVIYTAHGFHFHKTAERKNWMVYYSVEKVLSYFTDSLITINHEDYALAKSKMHAKNILYIPGMGIDFKRNFLADIDKAEVRKKLGVPEDAVLLTSVGELSYRKNHRVIIEAISRIKNKNIHFVILGKGSRKEDLLELARSLGVENQIHLPGFCENVIEINRAADIFCFPSRIEGLGIAALEAMASGLPVITSDVHGINDYSIDGLTGFKCSPDDTEGFVKAIKILADDENLRKQLGVNAAEKVKEFDLELVLKHMEKIYSMYT